MKNIYTYIKDLITDLKLPIKIKQALTHFSKTEWYIFLGLMIVLIVSTFGILQNINKSFMVEVPMQGGSIIEGVVGTPRFVNPILATTDADKDLVSLVYGGLMRKDSNGTLIPDLAETVEISKDGLVYTFTLKDYVYFHDDTKVTTNDVLFTINSIKGGIIQSPLKSNWDSVSVEKVDDKIIKFILKQPYASFLENTTVGIMPAHIWEGSPVELNTANTNPIGSGPYKVKSIQKGAEGIINSYEFSYFKKFNLDKPYIKNITFKFYQNEEDLVSALNKKQIEQASSLSPQNALKLEKEGYNVKSSVLPRVFGLFFNQNQNQIFTNKNIVTAINLAIDKEKIVKEVLSGYGKTIDTPIPPNLINYQKLEASTIVSYEEKLTKAKNILTKDGWTKGEDGFLTKTITEKNKKTTSNLEFSISTSNAPELSKTAEIIKQNLGSIGIKVEIKTFETGNLNQLVIRPRKYDALLFGQIINNESDLYAFWHSTQRKDPGLNVAMYTNAKVDKILEDAFVTVDETSRIKKYAQFEEEIKKDMPAVFLYSPDFIYVVSEKVKNLSIDHIVSPRDRLVNSYLWYIKTDSVWKIFSKQN